MPPFEVGNAVRTKVVDIANVTGAFYTNLMPEADGFKLIGKPMSEQRKNGTWAFINELHNQKLNSHYLARQFHNVPFHIYLNKKIDKLDFTGLKIRVTPVYKDIVEAIGGTTVTTAPGEVYTALERGVVDGYGWPVTGIFDLGWEKVTKFRMEPAFYSVEVNVLVNLDAWKGLTDAQKKVLSDAALWLEGLDSENVALIKAERDRQAEAGIQPIDFGAGREQEVPRQGQRRGLAVGDQARAGERRRSCGSWREIERHVARCGFAPSLKRCERRAGERGDAARIGPRLASHRSCCDPARGQGDAVHQVATAMTSLSNAFGRLLNALAVLAALTLLAMVVMVTADIVLRNLTRTGISLGQRSLRIRALSSSRCSPRRGCCAAASTCASTSLLTLVPARVAWLMEAAGDVIGFAGLPRDDALRRCT